MAKKEKNIKVTDKEEGTFRDEQILLNAGKVVVDETSDERSTFKGFAYKTSQLLIENVIAKKERTIFSELDNNGKLATTTPKMNYVDKAGKRVNLTPYQMKLVTALAQVVSTLIDKPEVSEYIKKLPYSIEDREDYSVRRVDPKDGAKPLYNTLEAVIDLTPFAKMIYPKGRIGGKQLDQIRSGLIELSELQQSLRVKDARGGTHIFESPLIYLRQKHRYEKNGVTKVSQMRIAFDDIFLYEINDKYSLSPITLLKLWYEAGVNTELFAMLLFLLQSVRGNYIRKAREIVEAKKRELKKAKVDPDEAKKIVEDLRQEKLTYKESLTSLLERVDKKRYLERGKYLRRDKIATDLKQATDALVKMGIITRYYETIGASGDKVCNFVINEYWILHEARKIKQSNPDKGKNSHEIPPPPEV
jgi:hypothetical protein